MARSLLVALAFGLVAPLPWLACGGPESTDLSPAPPAQTPSHDAGASDEAWTDPLVFDRFQLAPRQRVIVELGGSDADRAREEPPDGVAPRHNPALLREKEGLRLAAKADLARRLDIATADTVEVAHWYAPFSLMAVDATPAQVRALARMPDVVRIHADREETAQLASSVPAIAGPWFHANRGKGAGTAVAVLDTPVRYDNGHFGTCSTPGAPGCAVVATASFSSQTPEQVIAFEDAHDKGSHGTNVAAIVHGAAPDADLIGLNVFYWSEDDDGLRTTVSSQIDALAWVASHAATYDIVAINMSIGGTPEGPATCNTISRFEPIRSLWEDHGILTVISSGNDGEPNAVASPGCISMAVTVGAHFDTELDDYNGSCQQTSPVEREIGCFSNLSGMVDILAPGVFIDAGGYRKSGTSMAAPHVAGAVAAWQSFFLEDEGAFKTPFWMHKRLLMQSSAPHVHTDQRRFQRLDFDQSVRWDHGRAFPSWFRESSGNEIPSGSSSFETSMTVTGQGWDIDSAYLSLDVVHELPQHVQVEVVAPGGSSVTFKLPSGQAHFTGVIGRTVLPGALSSLAGSPADGTWTLRLRDTVGSHTGNYLQGAMYFVREGCSPKCEGESCGDDTCGGSCGSFCLIDGTCRANAEKNEDNPCLGCSPSSSTEQWTALQGDACDDGDPCTLGDSCEAGVCTGTAKQCPAPGPCEKDAVCDGQTGSCVYAPRPDGITCSDEDACTVADVCSEGECVGTPVTCTPPNACMRSAGCAPSTGFCDYVPETDGSPCPSGTCKSGSCVTQGGPSADAGLEASGGFGSDTDGGSEGGCGCSTPGRAPSGTFWWLLGGLAAFAGWRRTQQTKGDGVRRDGRGRLFGEDVS